MGILKWVDYTLSEPSFFKLMTDSTPLHLALLDEVILEILASHNSLHPLYSFLSMSIQVMCVSRFLC